MMLMPLALWWGNYSVYAARMLQTAARRAEDDTGRDYLARFMGQPGI